MILSPTLIKKSFTLEYIIQSSQTLKKNDFRTKLLKYKHQHIKMCFCLMPSGLIVSLEIKLPIVCFASKRGRLGTDDLQ